MRINFYIQNRKELLELMLQVGCRSIYKFKKIKNITYPREVVLVGNESDKFLWT